MALFTLAIFLPFTILLTCFAIQSKSIPSSEIGGKSFSSNPTLLQAPGASIEDGKNGEEGKDSQDRVLTEEELSRNGTIRNRLFGFNFNLDIGGRQSYSSSSPITMTSYHQAIVAAYCRNLMSAISNARLPPTPPVVVIDPVVTPPSTTNRPRNSNSSPTGSPSNVPPATEEEENLQIQSRTLHCLRTSSLFRSTDPYSTVLNMCTSIVTTGRWNY